MRLIGIDCATNVAKVGIALGALDTGLLTVVDVRQCSNERPVAGAVVDWIGSYDGPVLIAVDAPLGWPVSLGSTLSAHSAGQEIMVPSNTLFRRETDRFIQRELGKTPLDVGADRIARTAHAALSVLGELRRRLGVPIPLAWSPAALERLSVIEVYPAATLLAYGCRSTGYKDPAQIEERREVIRCLREFAHVSGAATEMERNSDALDAAICLLAAADFVAGRALPPLDHTLAAQEGWIWTRPRRPQGALEA